MVLDASRHIALLERRLPSNTVGVFVAGCGVKTDKWSGIVMGQASRLDEPSGLDVRAERLIDWRRRMSDNIAYALLVYTGLQIFVTLGAFTQGEGLVPYLALVVLIAAIIPACRRLEQRWTALDDASAADPLLAPRYRRDRLVLWLLAIGLPFGLTALFRALAFATG